MNRKAVIAVGLLMLAGQALATERLMPVGAMHASHLWKAIEPMSDNVGDLRTARMTASVDAVPAVVEPSVMHEAPAQSSHTAQSNAPWWRGAGGSVQTRLAGTPCDSR